MLKNHLSLCLGLFLTAACTSVKKDDRPPLAAAQKISAEQVDSVRYAWP